VQDDTLPLLVEPLPRCSAEAVATQYRPLAKVAKMIRFLGRSPDDLATYECLICKTEFDFRATDWKDREDYLSPKWCPICRFASVGGAVND